VDTMDFETSYAAALAASARETQTVMVLAEMSDQGGALAQRLVRIGRNGKPKLRNEVERVLKGFKDGRPFMVRDIAAKCCVGKRESIGDVLRTMVSEGKIESLGMQPRKNGGGPEVRVMRVRP
jgi:hypothetical protein